MHRHYLHAALHAARALDPAQRAVPEPPGPGVTAECASDGQRALAWFDAEHDVLLAVIAQAARTAGTADYARRIAWALEPFFFRRSNWQDLAATGGPRRAGPCLPRVQQLAEAAADVALMARACNNLGYDYALAGDTQNALSYCRRALDLCHQADVDPCLEGIAEDSLGYAYARTGDRRRAIASYSRAVRVFRKTGAARLEAGSLSDLGDCHAAAGDARAAVGAWQRALAILGELSHPGEHPDAIRIRRKIDDRGSAGRRSATALTGLIPPKQSSGTTRACSHAPMPPAKTRASAPPALPAASTVVIETLPYRNPLGFLIV